MYSVRKHLYESCFVECYLVTSQVQEVVYIILPFQPFGLSVFGHTTLAIFRSVCIWNEDSFLFGIYGPHYIADMSSKTFLDTNFFFIEYELMVKHYILCNAWDWHYHMKTRPLLWIMLHPCYRLIAQQELKIKI